MEHQAYDTPFPGVIVNAVLWVLISDVENGTSLLEGSHRKHERAIHPFFTQKEEGKPIPGLVCKVLSTCLPFSQAYLCD